MISIKEKNYNIYGLFSVFIFTILCFYPGLSGFYIFDDYASITHEQSLKLNIFDFENFVEIISSGHSGPLKRPISILSFSANINFTGLDPFPFKLTNLVIHLFNGFIIYLISRKLITHIDHKINSDLFALLVCSIFILHPLTITSVLYIVQRMTSLSAFFCLIGIYCYIQGRSLNPGCKSYFLIFLAFIVFTPLATLSKENGILLPWYLFLIEILFFRFESSNKLFSRFLIICASLSIFLPILTITIFYIPISEWIISGYNFRDFSIYERLLTETRAITLYLQLIIFPYISEMGLFHDDLLMSTSLTTPLSTLYSSLLLISLILFSLINLRRFTIFSFGILFFFLGHSIESTVLALEIAHEHRNYLPMFSIIFMISYYIFKLIPFVSKQYMFLIIGSILFFLGFSTAIRASQWGDSLLLPLSEVRNHPNSYRANHELARSYLFLAEKTKENKEKYENLSIKYINQAYFLKQYKAEVILDLIHYYYMNHKIVPDRFYQLLNQSITNSPTNIIFIVKLNDFTDCVIEKKCTPTTDQFTAIFNKIIVNNNINKDNKAKAIINLAKYNLAINNVAESINNLELAVQISDRFETRLVLANTLVDLNFIEEATQQINQLSKHAISPTNLKQLTILKNNLKSKNH